MTRGNKTSEFWMSVISMIGAFACILAGKIDVATGVGLITGQVAWYQANRTVLKFKSEKKSE